LFDGDTDDPASARFDHISTDNGIGRPISAFDEHIRLECGDDFVGRVLIEDYARVHDGESRKEFGAFGLGCDRAARSLVRTNRSIRVDADDERVAFLPGGGEIADVSRVQEIEHAVGEDDNVAFGAECADESCRFSDREHSPHQAGPKSMYVPTSSRG
jgi:hypothetical protein